MGKRWRRWIGILLTGWMLFSAVPTWAQAANSDTVTNQAIQVLVDGKQVQFSDVQPLIMQNRTFVPLRAVLEAMGATVWWDSATNTGYAEKDGVQIRMPLGSYQIYRNDQALQMDVPIQMVNDRLLIPLRFASQALGGTVNWTDATAASPMVITITSSGTNTETVGTAAEIEMVNGDGRVSSQQAERIKQILQDNQLSQKVSGKFGFPFYSPIRVYLAADENGYTKLLMNQGLPEQYARQVVQNTAGLTIQNSIFIPMSKLEAETAEDTESITKEIIAHELIHVLFNQNGIDAQHLPSWINEGLAMRAGFEIGMDGYPAVISEGLKKGTLSEIVKMKKAGNSIQLVSEYGKILLGDYATIESQNWMAVDYLYSQFGREKVVGFLHAIKNRTESAFEQTFGISESVFEKNLNAYLDQLVARPDRGVKISFRITENFQGDLGILPKGEARWRIYSLKPGNYSVTILPDGTIQGVSGAELANATGEPDDNFVFFALDLSTPVSENNKNIKFAGMVLGYGFGEYFYAGSWKDYTNGSSQYSLSAEAIGVEILKVESL